MAGTTANFSWPYPQSTDYVADGATAIENLADAIDTTVEERARGIVGYAEAFGTPILSNIIAVQDVPGLTFTVNVSTSKRYLWVATGFAIENSGSSLNLWGSIRIRDSGVSLIAQTHFIRPAFGNQITLTSPWQPTTGGSRTFVTSLQRISGAGQFDIFGTTFPWSMSLIEIGDA